MPKKNIRPRKKGKKRVILNPRKTRTPRKWEGSVFEKYAAKVAWNAYPSVSQQYVFDEIMNEASIKFYKLNTRYPAVNDRHLMSLFKTSLQRILQDMRKAIVRSNQESISTDLTTPINEGTALQDLIGEEHNLFDTEDYDVEKRMLQQELSDPKHIRRLVRDAPEEVKKAVGLIVSLPSEMLGQLIAAWRNDGRKKVLGSNMLCTLLGIPPRKAQKLHEEIILWMEKAHNDANEDKQS